VDSSLYIFSSNFKYLISNRELESPAPRASFGKICDRKNGTFSTSGGGKICVFPQLADSQIQHFREGEKP
jgi:hypothetical protein